MKKSKIIKSKKQKTKLMKYIIIFVIVFCAISGGAIAGYFIKDDKIIQAEKLDYEVVREYYHDKKAYTQGLIYVDGIIFESTGAYGHSSLRKYALGDSTISTEIDLKKDFFAEGIAILDNEIYQLTWQNQVGFVYDLNTFEFKRNVFYNGEGWGLTNYKDNFILSDGSSRLFEVEPETFKVVRTISVLMNGSPLKYLNELENVDGYIYANIWRTFDIAKINPKTGIVEGIMNFSTLLTPEQRLSSEVQNGIAYIPERNTFLITGKYWDKIYEIKIK